MVDRLAAEGVNYRRAYNQNTVCMPARSTMLTGQYVRTHGVVANGIPLPEDAPSIAAYLAEKAGYRTALLGKAHFEPGFDPQLKWRGERSDPARATRARGAASTGRCRRCTSPPSGNVTGQPLRALARRATIPSTCTASPTCSRRTPGGDTGAPETKNNPIPREWYHTDWVADLIVD